VFTSGLSVNEFALLRGLGPQPLAQVMGASVVRVGWQYLPALQAGIAAFAPGGYGAGPGATLRQDRWGNAFGEASGSQIRRWQWATPVVCRLDTVTDAWNLARREALARLTDEAIEAGADAVVGVTLQRTDHDLGKRTIEYVVNGTAVRVPGAPARDRPLLTDLSVQDYAKLLGGGQEPTGLAAATAVVFASPSRDTRIQRTRTIRRSQERRELSQGFGLARSWIRDELRHQVARSGGCGVVGVELTESIGRDKFALASSVGSPEQRGWSRGRLGIPYFVRGALDAERRGWVITAHASGTAIRPRSDAPGPPAWPPAEAQLRLGG
jgi:uncharacterized protein YbjQ (UPF0145 family)